MEFQRVKTDQRERKQVACNTKIDVSARPTVVGGTSSLWRECEFRKVKSIMRQQRSQLTGTLGCYIWSRRKRKKLNIDEKQKQKKKKGGGREMHPEDNFWQVDYLDSLSCLWSLWGAWLHLAAMFVMLQDRIWLWSRSLHLPRLRGPSWSSQIDLCRHALLHPRQTRTSDSMRGRCRTNWWQ